MAYREDRITIIADVCIGKMCSSKREFIAAASIYLMSAQDFSFILLLCIRMTMLIAFWLKLYITVVNRFISLLRKKAFIHPVPVLQHIVGKFVQSDHTLPPEEVCSGLVLLLLVVLVVKPNTLLLFWYSIERHLHMNMFFYQVIHFHVLVSKVYIIV